MLNTDAESVDDIVAANRRAVVNGIAILELGIVLPIQNIKSPVNNVVSITPIVDKMIPCDITGFISLYFVSMPPENRIIPKAIIPINCASSTLLNCKPKPSLPKSIPTTKKIRRAGIPNLYPVLLTVMLTNRSIEKIKRLFSAVNIML